MEWKSSREPSDAWHMTDDLRAETGKGDPFAAAIRATRMSMAITDPRRPDNPIVFANEAFLKLTGYGRAEVVGRNCRFLQGHDTDKQTVQEIRDAIASGSDISVDVLNYTKDGQPFWNALYISPVFNEKDELQFFFSSQLDVSDRKRSEQQLVADKVRFEEAVKARTSQLEAALEAKNMLLHEVDHRVKNNLQMISSLIIMQSRSMADSQLKRSLQDMLERIEAVSTVHRRLYQSDDVTRFNVSDFVRDLVTDLIAASGRAELRPEFELDPVVISAEKATPVALMINELVTNAVKHAFGEGHNGPDARIGVKLRNGGDDYTVEVFDNGRGIGEVKSGYSFGTKLIASLARQLRAKVEWRDGAPGTRVVITLPADKESASA